MTSANRSGNETADRVLVTGANGLIGANLIRELLLDGYPVRALVRRSSDLRSLESLNIELVYGDVLDAQSLPDAMQGCRLVFHSAAVFSYTGMQAAQLDDIAVNGTLNVLQAAQQAGVRRVVFTSSSVVLGSSSRPLPRNEQDHLNEHDSAPYILAKQHQEQAAFEQAERLGTDVVAVCPTMSIGPYGYTLGPSNAVIVSYLSDSLRTTFPGGCNIVAVRDVARGHILVAEKGVAGERYLLGAENLTWKAVHTHIAQLCGVPAPRWQANHTESLLAATAHELAARFSRSAPLTTRIQARMVGRYYWYRHAKAAALGYRPRSARQALTEAIAWLTVSPHISREVRSRLRLSRDVFQARKAMEVEQAAYGGRA